MLIRSGDVTLIRFEPALSDIVFAVRNHPSVRANLRNTAPILRENHQAWVEENLIRNQRVHLFVVQSGADPVGIALLRNFQRDSAEIGVMVVDAETRPLVCYKAAHLVGYYGFELLDLKRLFSFVPRSNARALAFNQHCGLTPVGAGSAEYHALALSQTESRSHPTHRRFRTKYGITVLEGRAEGDTAR